MRNYLDIAKKYHKAGFHVVPVREDKKPTCKWKPFQEKQSVEDIERIFSQDSHGIAALTGINGLEVIDVDEKYALGRPLMVDFMKHNDNYTGNAVSFTDLTVQKTRSGGYHIMYRCKDIEGNQKLAMRPGTGDELYQHNESSENKITDPAHLPAVLLETRGVGGYILVPPTPGYEIEWGSMKDIPEITPRQRAMILQAARCFDDMPQESQVDIRVHRESKSYSGKTPWDDYNEKTHAVDLLKSYGWREVYETSDKIFMLRPGESAAKTSGNYHKGKGIFVSHSTSTPFDVSKGYTAYAIYTQMEHGGNFSESAKALSEKGFGDRMEASIATDLVNVSPEKKQAEDDELLAFVRSTKFDITKPITEEKAILTSRQEGNVYKIAGSGMMGAVVGAKKSAKTLITSAITAAGLSGNKELMTFELDLQGKGIAYFDTEQSKYFYLKTQERLHHLAGYMSRNSVSYEAYHLRQLDVSKRMRAIDLMLRGRKDLGLVIIDGIVDLCKNFNNEVESQHTIEKLLQWSDKTGALFITVLHLTKEMGFMRGHLGTALENKCDFSIECRKDGDSGIFSVRCRDSRFAPWPGFDFTRDEDGYPEIDGRSYHPDREDMPVPTQFPADMQTDYKSPLIAKTANLDEELPF